MGTSILERISGVQQDRDVETVSVLLLSVTMYALLLVFIVLVSAQLIEIPTATVNAVIGGLLAVGAVVVTQQKRHRDRVRRLQTALSAEVEELGRDLDAIEETTTVGHGPVLSTQVYDSNAEIIGELDEESVRAIVSFYAEVKRIRNGVGGEDVSEGGAANVATSNAERVERAQVKHENVLKSLNDGD